MIGSYVANVLFALRGSFQAPRGVGEQAFGDVMAECSNYLSVASDIDCQQCDGRRFAARAKSTFNAVDQELSSGQTSQSVVSGIEGLLCMDAGISYRSASMLGQASERLLLELTQTKVVAAAD